MAGAGTIAVVAATVGAAVTLGVAHQQSWGAFGEFGQDYAVSSSCKPSVLAVGWWTGAGARSFAETRALIGWSKRADRHGKKYSSWHNARSRNVSCSIIKDKTAKCTVKGRPCLRNSRTDLDNLF